MMIGIPYANALILKLNNATKDCTTMPTQPIQNQI